MLVIPAIPIVNVLEKYYWNIKFHARRAAIMSYGITATAIKDALSPAGVRYKF